MTSILGSLLNDGRNRWFLQDFRPSYETMVPEPSAGASYRRGGGTHPDPRSTKRRRLGKLHASSTNPASISECYSILAGPCVQHLKFQRSNNPNLYSQRIGERYDITWRDVLGRTGDEGSRMKDPTYGRPLRQRNDILGNMSLKFGGSRCACAHGYYLVVNAVRLSSGHPFHPGILFIWTSLSSGRAFHPGVPFIQASLSSGRPFHPGIINTTALPEVAFTEDTTPDFIIVVDNTYVLKVKILIRVGTSINSFLWSEGKVPIVYGNEVTNNCSESDAESCYLSCLEESRIHGKVVMCVFYAGIEAVKVAGALGCIAPNLGNNVSDITTFPTAALSANDFNLIKKYKISTRNPEAKILKSEANKNPDAPFVASDSSRGPSMYFPDLIKKNHKAVLGRMERVLQLQRKVPKIVAHLLFGDVVTVTGFNTFVISVCTPHALSEMRWFYSGGSIASLTATFATALTST
ncbi:hypothetical protein Tco_0456547 [Tanacetum coccineum]